MAWNLFCKLQPPSFLIYFIKFIKTQQLKKKNKYSPAHILFNCYFNKDNKDRVVKIKKKRNYSTPVSRTVVKMPTFQIIFFKYPFQTACNKLYIDLSYLHLFPAQILYMSYLSKTYCYMINLKLWQQCSLESKDIYKRC